MFVKTIASTILLALSAVAAPAAFSGDATYYNPNGGTGACGKPLQNSDLIVALSSAQYSGGSNCSRRIGATFLDQGKSVDASVEDSCPGCGSGSIDLSPAAFQQLAPLSAGRIQVTWDFV